MRLNIWTQETIDVKRWNAFVQRSNSGTLFSEASFYQHHDVPADVKYLGIEKGNKLVAGIVGRRHENRFKSPHMASYGGILTDPSLRFGRIEEALKLIFDYFAEQGISTMQVTPAPICYRQSTDESLDFLFHYNGADLHQSLITSAVQVSDYSLKHSCRGSNRRAIQKAMEKGVQVEKSDALELFYPILLANKEKFDLKPTHSLSELKKLFRLYPDRMNLWLARVNKKVVAGLINFSTNKTCDLTFYIASIPEFNQYNVVPLLIHNALLGSKKDGKIWLDLGVSMETSSNNPMEPRRSLIFFKSQFGANSLLRNTYEVPVS